MKFSAFCPVSDKKINEKVARFNAGFTVLLLVVFGLTHNILPIILLAVDFLLRGNDLSKYSLIAISSKGIVKYLPVNQTWINAGPKIFAARIGLLMSSLIIVLIALNFTLAAYGFAIILGVFSFLESAFGFCVACEIYPLVYKLLYKLNLQN